MKIKKIVELKEKIDKSNTIGEGEKIVNDLDWEDLVELRDALKLVSESFGVTMRDDFYLKRMEARIVRQKDN